MLKNRKTAFTLVEVLVAATIMLFILYFAYQIFFSQSRAVTQTIDALQANEGEVAQLAGIYLQQLNTRKQSYASVKMQMQRFN